MLAGVNQKLIDLYEKLLLKCPAGYTKNEMRDMVGKYFSVEYMRKNVLKQSESEIQ